MVRVNHPVGSHIQRQGEEHHRLRPLRRRRGGHRRPGARLRPALDEEGQAPVRALQEGRRGRGGRARHRRRQRAHLARRQAAHRGSVGDRCRSAIRSATRVQRQGDQRHRLRRVRRDRGGRRGARPRLAALHRAGRQAAGAVQGRATRSRRRSRSVDAREKRKIALSIKALRTHARSARRSTPYMQREREGGTLLLRGHPERGPATRPRRARPEAAARGAESTARPSEAPP